MGFIKKSEVAEWAKKKKNKDLQSQGKEKILQSYKNISASKNFLLKNREHIALATLFDTWPRSLFTFGLWGPFWLSLCFM